MPQQDGRHRLVAPSGSRRRRCRSHRTRFPTSRSRACRSPSLRAPRCRIPPIVTGRERRPLRGWRGTPHCRAHARATSRGPAPSPAASRAGWIVSARTAGLPRRRRGPGAPAAPARAVRRRPPPPRSPLCAVPTVRGTARWGRLPPASRSEGMPSSRPTEPGRRLCSCGPPRQAERCRASLASGAASPSRWRSVRPTAGSAESRAGSAGRRGVGSPGEISQPQSGDLVGEAHAGREIGQQRCPSWERRAEGTPFRQEHPVVPDPTGRGAHDPARRTWARIRDMRPVRSNAISRTPCSSGSACGAASENTTRSTSTP